MSPGTPLLLTPDQHCCRLLFPSFVDAGKSGDFFWEVMLSHLGRRKNWWGEKLSNHPDLFIFKFEHCQTPTECSIDICCQGNCERWSKHTALLQKARHVLPNMLRHQGSSTSREQQTLHSGPDRTIFPVHSDTECSRHVPEVAQVERVLPLSQHFRTEERKHTSGVSVSHFFADKP